LDDSNKNKNAFDVKRDRNLSFIQIIIGIAYCALLIKYEAIEIPINQNKKPFLNTERAKYLD